MASMEVSLPTFDMHNVEAALRQNHKLFSGTPITEEQIASSVEDYKKFLQNHKERGTPDDFLVPPPHIDRVWHTHMCETRQYAEDCMAYFGKILHHSAGLCDDHPAPSRYQP